MDNYELFRILFTVLFFLFIFSLTALGIFSVSRYLADREVNQAEEEIAQRRVNKQFDLLNEISDRHLEVIKYRDHFKIGVEYFIRARIIN